MVVRTIHETYRQKDDNKLLHLLWGVITVPSARSHAVGTLW